MKIVFVVSYLSDYGGTVRVASELANGLSNRGYDVSIISRGHEPAVYYLVPSINDVRVGGNFLAFLKAVKNYCETHQPYAVIVHTMSKLTPLLLMMRLGIKLWSIEHTSFAFHSFFYRWYRRFFYRFLDRVIVLTEHERGIFKKINQETVKIHNPSPFEIKQTAYNQDSRKVVSIGALMWYKGYDQLLLAWQEVQSKFPDWELEIYGEGEERQNLEKQIKSLGLNNVYLKGLTDNALRAYDEASFYVMTSKFEGLPMVLIEAQTRGLPIVSFDCPSGPAEIITHQRDGVLVDNGNVHQFAQCMVALMQDNEQRSALSRQAVISAKKYQINTVIEQWDTLLRDM